MKTNPARIAHAAHELLCAIDEHCRTPSSATLFRLDFNSHRYRQTIINAFYKDVVGKPVPDDPVSQENYEIPQASIEPPL